MNADKPTSIEIATDVARVRIEMYEREREHRLIQYRVGWQRKWDAQRKTASTTSVPRRDTFTRVK